MTKPLVALAVLVAIEEGSLALDQPLGPPGSTVSHVLSHSSGLAPETPDEQTAGPAPPFATAAGVGSKRIYSNQGYELLGRAVEESTGIDMATYFHEAVVEPLGLTATRLDGSPAHGAVSSVDDLLIVAGELMHPTLVSQVMLWAATTPHLPGLDGVLPGFGRQNPNPWGLGFEVRGEKSPHWTGSGNSPTTFGHFGRTGTFLWIDPEAGLALTALTDRDFGPWAIDAWPRLADRVLSAAAG